MWPPYFKRPHPFPELTIQFLNRSQVNPRVSRSKGDLTWGGMRWDGGWGAGVLGTAGWLEEMQAVWLHLHSKQLTSTFLVLSFTSQPSPGIYLCLKYSVSLKLPSKHMPRTGVCTQRTQASRRISLPSHRVEEEVGCRRG